MLEYMSRKELEHGLVLARGEITVKERGKDPFQVRPTLLLEAFAVAQQVGAGLSEDLKVLIRTHLGAIDDAFRADRPHSRLFMTILKHPKASRALRAMHEVGVLSAYLPEFEPITGLVHHDLYHKYTVDEHTLRAVDFGKCERMVRINQLPLGLEDLAEIVPESPDLVLLPKVERPEHVAETDRMVGELRNRYGITRPIWLMPILESALGIENASAIARVSKNVIALTIGLEDYTTDIGVAKTKEGGESLYARMRLVNAAKAAGVQAIDSVFGDVGDMASLRIWAKSSRALGFEGMGCIHPSQIPVIHEAFAPSSSEIEKASKIVAAFEEAQQRGLGVVSLGSKMIDPPVVERAQKLVERAKKMAKT